MGDGGSGFMIVWEFEVEPAQVDAFRRMYGPAGDWARLFGRAGGHVETLLLEDTARPGRFLTLDRWTSEEDYRAFRARHRDEYDALDAAGEARTARERQIGTFAVRP